MRLRLHKAGMVVAAIALATPMLRAAERVTLRNGFEFDCVRREAQGEKVRLYFSAGAGAENYLDVAANDVVSVEQVADPVMKPVSAAVAKHDAGTDPTAAELNEMLAKTGAEHNVDRDLLASVVKAESNGHTHAVSRTGARGLMQLMPGTAATMGVQDSFAAEQNVEGGARYLDALLTRYHDNMALALAAYNAGPAAVDKYHGVPPYRETRGYVARVIREFNRRKLTLVAQAR